MDALLTNPLNPLPSTHGCDVRRAGQDPLAEEEPVSPMDGEGMYRALESRDPRFDGQVFVGIRTTGIYCRPICPARTPKFQNCEFYLSAAAAQEAGYRPCLRCRPEIAPRSAMWHGTSSTVSRALSLVEEGAMDGDDASVAALAMRLGVGERQLRRLFMKHLGASPLAVAQTRRVLFAKQLLHDTQLPIPEVAIAAGFGSERRFHEVFQKVFGRKPLTIRKAGTTDVAPPGDGVTLRVRYRAPYDWDALLQWLMEHAQSGVDTVADGEYLRSVTHEGIRGRIHVRNDAKRQSLLVTMALLPVRSYPSVLSRVRRLFDVDADLVRIERDLARDRMLAPLVRRYPGMRVAGSWQLSSASRVLHNDGFHGDSAEMLRFVKRLDRTVKTNDDVWSRAGRWRPWRAYAEQLLLRQDREGGRRR